MKGMPRAQDDLPVTLSVLDRLIDTDPTNSTEAPLRPAQTRRQMKEALRRDLEWLLNTRRIAIEPDEALTEVNRSLYVYGLPDLSSYSLASQKDQAKLLRIIQSTLKTFEPRLAHVRIASVEIPTSGLQALRLRIEGMLNVGPAPEYVSFDTLFELRSGTCRVRGDADAG
jgi:type VI secretion system protein ImpF